jgi:hypothetical protein
MKEPAWGNSDIFIIFLEGAVTHGATCPPQKYKASNWIQYKENKHDNTKDTVPDVEGFGGVVELSELKRAGPYNRKISESDKLVKVGESIVLVVRVVFD